MVCYGSKKTLGNYYITTEILFQADSKMIKKAQHFKIKRFKEEKKKDVDGEVNELS